jgi:transposase
MKVDGQQAFPGKGRLKEDEELIRRLKRENEMLRQEREILKKALAIFFRAARSALPIYERACG